MGLIGNKLADYKWGGPAAKQVLPWVPHLPFYFPQQRMSSPLASQDVNDWQFSQQVNSLSEFLGYV